jgi:hypothetical protein
MKIDKFKQQHLAVEQRYLYPAAQACGVAKVARLGRQYENDMHGIAGAYLDFAGRWNTPVRLAAEPEASRSEANTVLHALTQRMRREDTELYPTVETLV